jgi:dienelactone hydrolase
VSNQAPTRSSSRRETSTRPVSWLRRQKAPKLFLYPGEGHLLVDDSGPDYDAGATMLLTQRVLTFLHNIE